MIRGVFSKRFLRAAVSFGEWNLRARFDVHENQLSNKFFATGEIQETYQIAPVGCDAGPVTTWVDEDFLVSSIQDSSVESLLDKITDQVAQHFMMEDKRAIIRAELTSQYRLMGIDRTGATLHFRIDIFRNRSSSKFFATVERRSSYEILQWGYGKPRHVEIWSQDEICEIIEDAVADNESDLLKSSIEKIVQKYSLADDMIISTREHQSLLERYDLDRVGMIDDPDPEPLYVRVNIDRNCLEGNLVASAETLNCFEVQPVDNPDVAHVNMWVEDPIVTSVIERMSANDVSTLSREAVARIMNRYQISSRKR